MKSNKLKIFSTIATTMATVAIAFFSYLQIQENRKLSRIEYISNYEKFRKSTEELMRFSIDKEQFSSLSDDIRLQIAKRALLLIESEINNPVVIEKEEAFAHWRNALNGTRLLIKFKDIFYSDKDKFIDTFYSIEKDVFKVHELIVFRNDPVDLQKFWPDRFVKKHKNLKELIMNDSLYKFVQMISQIFTTIFVGIGLWIAYRTFLKIPTQEPEPTMSKDDNMLENSLAVFDTSKQRTELKVSGNNLECHLHDKKRKDRNPLQWVLSKDIIKDILDNKDYGVFPGYKMRTGTFYIGPKKNWLNSKKIFPVPRMLEQALHDLLKRTVA